MIRSMTAFSRATSPSGASRWSVEIRSINHRFFEFLLKLPPALSPLESPVRELVQSVMRRGKIMVAISQESQDGKEPALKFDEDLISFYVSEMRRIQKRFKLAGEITASDILKLPGVFTSEESAADAEKVWPSIKKVLQQALTLATKAKELEGQKLAKDIDARLDLIAQTTNKIEKAANGQAEKIYQRLSERVAVLIGEKERDADKIEREVAFLAERSDITEEVVRMRSHLDLFKTRLKATGEVGRELDFLCQEMNREVNTMGSKAQLFEISTHVVLIKGELEKIREQIQNIE